MYRRILSFSYEEDYDPLLANEIARKMAYNISDSPYFSSFLQQVELQNREAQKKLFEKEKVIGKNGKENSQYKDQKIIDDGKKEYQEKHGDSTDELSGKSGENLRLEVDHVQAAATIMYHVDFTEGGSLQRSIWSFGCQYRPDFPGRTSDLH